MLAAPPFLLLDNLNAVDDTIDTNAEIAEAILDLGLRAFNLPSAPTKNSPLNWHNTAKASDVAKAHSTIRQFYRDWSAEGAVERDLITNTVLQDLTTHLPPSSQQSVLVPGAGLARLVFDLTLHGYSATGNEISYHQVLASNWILNQTAHTKQHNLFPFATTFTNLYSRTQQLARVQIPDIHPASAIASCMQTVGEMNMHVGDFVRTYSSIAQRDAFSAIASVFFIDTAPNLLQYISTVRNCLQDGGVWINIGPLLWHFDEKSVGEPDEERHRRGEMEEIVKDQGIAEPGSFELTDEEVVLLLQQMGFEVLTYETMDSGKGLGYIQDPDSMLQNLYQCSHWVVRKAKDGE